MTVQPQDFRADVVMEQRLLVVGAVRFDGGTTGAQTAFGFGAYDFPPLGITELATPCAESHNIAAPGSSIGQGCTASSNLGMDGGSVLSSTALLTCRAGTNVAVLKLCFFATDGGSYNLHDAGFFVRTSL
jgi:hypothetical protein